MSSRRQTLPALCWVAASAVCVAGYSLWQVEEDMSLSRDGGCHGVGAALCATISMHEAAVGSGD